MRSSLAIVACCLLPALTLAATVENVEPRVSFSVITSPDVPSVEDRLLSAKTIAYPAAELAVRYTLLEPAFLPVSGVEGFSDEMALATGSVTIEFRSRRNDSRFLFAAPQGTRSVGRMPIYKVTAPSAISTMLSALILVFALRPGVRARRRQIYRRSDFRWRYVRRAYSVSALFRFSSSFSRKPMVVSQP